MRKIVFVFILLVFVLISEVSFSQELKNSSWSQVLLNKTNIGLLPNNPFYFLKEWQRGIKKFFTFDPIKKVELELEYADEKIVELEKVSQTLQRKEVLQKALNNYLQSQEKLAQKLDALPQNKKVEELTQKLTERVVLHQVLFNEITNKLEKMPEGQEILKEVANKNIQQSTIIAKPNLSITKITEPERLNKIIDKLPYAEGVKELKALEVLTKIEEKLPEESKRGIETAKEMVQKKLVETNEIQKVKDWKIEQGASEDRILIEGVPVETKALEKVVEKLEKIESSKPVKTISESNNIQNPSLEKKININNNVEAVKELKMKLQESAGRDLEKGDLSQVKKITDENVKKVDEERKKENASNQSINLQEKEEKKEKISPQNVLTPYVRVVSPNGGETLYLGEIYRISWDFQWAPSINVEPEAILRLIAFDKKTKQESFSLPLEKCKTRMEKSLEVKTYSCSLDLSTTPSSRSLTPEREYTTSLVLNPEFEYKVYIEVITQIFERGTPDYVYDFSDAPFNVEAKKSNLR